MTRPPDYDGNVFINCPFDLEYAPLFEAIVFADTLAASRDLLEPGTPVLVTVEAEREGDTVKLRAQVIEQIEDEHD